MTKIIIESSARHVHLSQHDLEKLFGVNYKLNKLRDLSQPGEFAAQETLAIKTPKNKLEKIRVVSPLRPQTQVEISKTDALILGLNPPVRNSGDLANSDPCILVGPVGEISLSQGVILAQRHIHVNSKFLAQNGLSEKESVSVKVDGERGLVFNNVYLKSDEKFMPVFHIDTDEANAAGINKTGEGEIIV
ncbi:MAG: phosphate propanoyltransferase [Patescibacteria group bacterium]|nr:phosphate propanoyltransferase [Patescibacteria group bacterium]MDD5121437.1 phosphate propanoyltransferase [Patescibacteria group bacterium]MDD5222290.1 phosphate propanoyltransferase [Patescibacteria group bacterium]MDD5395644.1 phosphate propanoyltransferase [Patescibacteria group bacterium]